jgi:DNA-binding MarR family transcriptional regulator
MQQSASDDRSTFEVLMDEVRLLWNVLVQTGESLHADEPISMGMRAVLEYLLGHGPTTVPDIARSRHVTRQHIQQLVNALLERDLVALTTNPAHKRSALVALTAGGEQMIRRMKEREASVFARLDLEADDHELRAAVLMLRRVRRVLEGDIEH